VNPSAEPELATLPYAEQAVSDAMPTTAFVFYLQNHDQIGNRPFGERLTTLAPDRALRVANALQLLTPHIPMLFMGEEYGATQPFLYFTSHENPDLVEAVREGRRREFHAFKKFADSGFALRIPDPNHRDTFDASIPRPTSVEGVSASTALDWSQWISKLLGIRHQFIIPRLPGTQALFAKAIGPSAVVARWQMGDGAILAIAANLGSERLTLSRQDICDGPQSQVLFDYGEVWQMLEKNILPGNAFIAILEGPL
jgi:maltooligosyltrehalose trehalohydrolase